MRAGCAFSSPFDLSNIYFITHPHLYMGEMVNGGVVSERDGAIELCLDVFLDSPHLDS